MVLRVSSIFSILVLGLCLGASISLAAAPVPHPGAIIYEKLCLDCHGKNGQGVDGKYDEPLIGERTVEALARKIEKTMPEDNEGACVGEDAKAVAEYMYDAFYSPAAQARMNPPARDLTRLTIPQFRNSVMDLVGRFYQGPGFDRPINKEQGIRGFYRGFEVPVPEPEPVAEPVVVTPPPVPPPAQPAVASAPPAAKPAPVPAAPAPSPSPVTAPVTQPPPTNNVAATKVPDKATTPAPQATASTPQAKAPDPQAQPPAPAKTPDPKKVADAKKRVQPKPEEKKRKPFQFDRVDGRIAFYFGADSPNKEKMIPEEFQIRWDGCVVAPETGVYEFSVRSENGVRLFINETEKAFIDGWVTPGPDVREEKKSIFLVGGRAYRLMLEHFKFKEKSASVELWWKPPHGTKEIIPARHLHNDRPQPRLIVSTNFPADDRSVGYERGTTISKAWDQAVTEAAMSAAEVIDKNLDRLAGTKLGAPDRKEKLLKLAGEFVETAFCRPLTEEQRLRYVETQFKTAKSPELAVKRVVILTLKSPRFLYPVLREEEKPDTYAVAARLALNLWDSLPDRHLLKAVRDGKLNTPEQVRAYAQQMVADPRTKAKLHGFFHHWLDLEHAEHTSKDLKAFPGFNTEVLADLRDSLLEFIDQVVWNEKSDYRELLRADYLLLNDRLAKFYGQSVKGDAFQRVSFDPKQRAGVVTHPYLLSSMAYSRQTSPIHRGVFLTRNIVGMSLKPPPMAVAFEDSHFNPSLTMREKITELTRSNACMSCHSTINPLGFSLENFDAIGRWRTKDNNKPVNPVAEFSDEEGKTIRLTGPRDIVNYVADNPSGHRAFIRHLFNHTVKQQIPAYGPQVLDKLQASFSASGCNIQKMLVEIALVDVLNGTAK